MDLLSTASLPARVAAIYGVVLLCLTPWVKAVVARAAPGLPRLLCMLPVLAFCWLSPMLFDARTEVLEKFLVIFFFGWLASMKVSRLLI